MIVLLALCSAWGSCFSHPLKSVTLILGLRSCMSHCVLKFMTDLEPEGETNWVVKPDTTQASGLGGGMSGASLVASPAAAADESDLSSVHRTSTSSLDSIDDRSKASYRGGSARSQVEFFNEDSVCVCVCVCV